ncbi:MAG: ABC transporter ATP-binding protein [Clostridiales bacterium]|nr:ABC transporter ATP-binding protein [Candidatus Cacconaster stercorequi]
MDELLRMEHISKRFGDFYANKKIDLTVKHGEVHTLLGENGAGKSTLMNILIGLYQPTEGKIFVNGKEEHIDSPAHAVKLGIGMVHQHFMLVEAMTVFENIILGDRNVSGLFIDRDARRREIEELSEKYGLDVELDKLITEISVGAQQRVEILKALYHGAELLVLDEPSAALTDIEVEGLFAIMRKLVSEGKSIIFISHKMREVLHISDRITVLRLGEVIGTVNCAETDGKALASMMIGRELSASQYEKMEAKGECVAELKNVDYNKNSKHNGLNGVSMKVHRGEIVGIAGVDGNGQTQLAQLITGVLAPQSGSVELKGKSVSVYDPSSFIKNGVSHVPEDRNLQGLVGDMSITDNLVLKATTAEKFSRGKGLLLKKRDMARYAGEMVGRYDIRCTSVEQTVRSLSGGNQQKVILAREMESEPDLLVAAHPTRGLDIGATRFVHDKMIEARDKGVGILLISADFDEILEVSDRILVFFEGRIMGEYSGKNPPVEEISLAMTGK